jgi:glycosyltransferase involved in cell wall biosynthesis
MPKVAVITRTKDRGILLERAIKSVHSQTMQDFVQVILNDAGNKEIVDSLVDKYKDLIDGRVKVIHNTKSKGLSAALNKAIQSINSEYIAVHDDDDTWDENFLKLTTEFLDENKAKGVITVVDIVDEEIKDGKVETIKTGRGLEPVRGVVSLYDQCLANYATPITFIYRRDVYDEIGGYNQDFEVAEDWDFTLRFLMKYDINSLVTENALSFYHHRNGSNGTELNSIFIDGGTKFDLHIKKIANYHLRKELAEGYLGLGYLISSIRSQWDAIKNQNDALNEQINESVKHELHFVASDIKSYVDERAKSTSDNISKDIANHSIKHSITKILKKRD